MSTVASQITGVSIVYSTVCSGADQRKHQSSVSLFFVRGIHRWLVNSPHKWPVTRKMLSFDDVIMIKFTDWPLLTGDRSPCLSSAQSVARPLRAPLSAGLHPSPSGSLRDLRRINRTCHRLAITLTLWASSYISVSRFVDFHLCKVCITII